MVVQLSFVFLITIHLRNSLQVFKHRIDNFVIRCVHTLSHLQTQPICANRDELTLDALDIIRKLFNERCNSFTFLRCNFGLLNGFKLVILLLCENLRKSRGKGRTTCRSKTPLRRVCCLLRKLTKNWFPFSFAFLNFSSVASTPTISL